MMDVPFFLKYIPLYMGGSERTSHNSSNGMAFMNPSFRGGR